MSAAKGTLEWGSEFSIEHGDNVQVLRLCVPFERIARMTPRQLHDLQAGYRLLRSAMLPDAFFHGHPAGDDNEGPSVMARIEIVGALEQLQCLPQVEAEPSRG
jgi:hypothetical protein